MNTTSYPASLKANGEACLAIGDFVYDEDKSHLYIVLPRANGKFGVDVAGRAVLDCIPISRAGSSAPRTWHWDGNEASPTLQPSILLVDHWHGYLTNGQLQSC